MSQLLPRALAALLLAGASSPDAAGAAEVSPVAAAQQLLLVVTPTWDSPTGTLQRFERESRSGSAVVGRKSRSGSAGGWRPVGAAIAVSVGRKGLAWRSDDQGQAAVAGAPGPRKREGDGRAPAGVLVLGDAWGYDAAAPPGTRLRYHAMDAQDRCVDDPAAPAYNRLVKAPAGAPPWASAEVLRRGDALYRYLIVVRYNTDPPRPGAGSCIFVHLHSAPGAPTAGCTAMAEADLLTLLRWLDPARGPLLLQLPRPALAGALSAYGIEGLQAP